MNVDARTLGRPYPRDEAVADLALWARALNLRAARWKFWELTIAPRVLDAVLADPLAGAFLISRSWHTLWKCWREVEDARREGRRRVRACS